MIKPNEISHIKPVPKPDPVQVRNLEKAFDEAIRLAGNTGCWPAEVERSREPISQESLEYVCQLYREEGWVVTPITSGRRPCPRATIQHPAIHATNADPADTDDLRDKPLDKKGRDRGNGHRWER